MRKHFPGLDLLRATAIVLVLLAHYPKVNDGLATRILNFGWTGVDLFFVLSGFLIGSQVFQALTAGDNGWVRTFYLRRLLRTLPPYYAVLAVYFALATLLPVPAPQREFLFFAQNFDIPLTFTASWSLCVEEQFYLLFPLAALLFLRIRSVRMLGYSILVFLAGAVCVRFAVWSAWRPDLLPEPQALTTYMRTLYYPTYCRLDGIALGVGLAALRCFHARAWRWLTERGNLLLTASGAFMLLSIGALWKHYSVACSTVGFTFLNVSFVLLTASAMSSNGVLHKIRIPGITYLAAVSYSVYLTHSLAIELTGRVLESQHIAARSAFALGPTLAAILLFALVLYYGVERPSLAFRDRLFRRNRPRPRVLEVVPGSSDAAIPTIASQ